MKRPEFSEEFVERISDKFESTFHFNPDNSQTISNMLYEDDIPVVKEIIKEELVRSTEVSFQKTNQMDGQKDIYLIKIT